MGDGARERDQERAARQRQFSRRELLRAGVAVPAVLALPALATACGSPTTTTNGPSTTANPGVHGDHTDTGHHDAAHVDSVHTDTSHSDRGHGDAVHTDTGHGDTGGETPTTRHSTTSSATTSPRHLDTAHVDVPHSDIVIGSQNAHDDSGKHADATSYSYSDVAGPPHTDGYYTPSHLDSGTHADMTTNIAGGHGDTAHGDTPHGDHTAS